MLSPYLDDLANLKHEERLRSALRHAAYACALDGGPPWRQARRVPRARLGALLIRAGAWIGGFEAEQPQPQPRPRPAIVN